MKTLRVELKERSYPVYIGRGAVFETAALLRAVSKAKRLVLITDEHIASEHGLTLLHLLREGDYEAYMFTVSAGEEAKTLTQYAALMEKLTALRLQRSDAILALGGGAVGDLAGFAAASLNRGVDLIVLPTTLLSQVDSAIGGKNGLNTAAGKNLVGTFYQPKLVLIDPNYLDSLPLREKNSGMAEVIKCALIGDAEMFTLLEGCEAYRFPMESVIYRCCAMKAAFVAADELDKGARRALNFGHTFGHAYERAYGYSAYTHGEAVAAGMVQMLRMQGANELAERLEALLERYDLPTRIDCLPETLADGICSDKKNTGDTITVVEVPQLGSFALRETTVEALLEGQEDE